MNAISQGMASPSSPDSARTWRWWSSSEFDGAHPAKPTCRWPIEFQFKLSTLEMDSKEVPERSFAAQVNRHRQTDTERRSRWLQLRHSDREKWSQIRRSRPMSCRLMLVHLNLPAMDNNKNSYTNRDQPEEVSCCLSAFWIKSAAKI